MRKKKINKQTNDDKIVYRKHGIPTTHDNIPTKKSKRKQQNFIVIYYSCCRSCYAKINNKKFIYVEIFSFN